LVTEDPGVQLDPARMMVEGRIVMADSNPAAKDPAGGRELSRRELFQLVVPRLPPLSWGRLILDPGKCSACGLCARECHSQALVAAGDSGLVLTFRADQCDACGKCLEVCPEQCLTPESKDAGKPASLVVLFEDDPALCRVCGAVIGSRAMIERVRARLAGKDPVLAAKLQLCPACKSK
jgi:ferredoxin